MMTKTIRRATILAAICATCATSFAQYPQVPADVQKAADARKDAADKASDAAWIAAQPAMKADEANGRFYHPYAAKPTDLPQAGIPSFPGAEGGGMYSKGGRGGKVFTVTSLEDSGPGSFREACEAGGARTILFNVSGVIRLKDRIRIRAPYVTIDGSHAPGDGVCIAGGTVELETHDIIVRHMRFRRGETDAGDRNDSFGGNPIGNVMIDHVSASWGLDECMSMYRHMYSPPDGSKDLKLPTVNITIQNSIFSEAINLYNHAFGSTIGGYNSTFHHNLWACNAGRNPSIGMNGDFAFFNNVVFNWVHRTTDGGDNNSEYNIINNYWKPGPATPTTQPIGHRILKMDAERTKDANKRFGKAYVNGNVVEGDEKVTANNWDGGVQLDEGYDAATILPAAKMTEPFAHATVTITDAKQAYADVLAHAGARMPKQDAVDARVINFVRTGEMPPESQPPADLKDRLLKVKFTEQRIEEIRVAATKGIIVDPAQVGGYPKYEGTPYKDSDGDGLPDDYETSHGLNPNDAADGAKMAGEKDYTNLEKYLYGIDPSAKTDWTDLKNNVDPMAK